MTSRRILLAASAALFGLPWPALAQTFPSKGVRIIVPYTAGGATDSLARVLAEALGQIWKERVLVENKPGASTMLGADTVAKSDPDGTTLLFSDSSAFVIVPHIQRAAKLDPRRDFAPAALVARQTPVLAARGDFPARTVSEFLTATGGGNPLTYGSFGVGTWSHVAMERLQQTTGSKLTHVPYRGTSQLLTDAVGGRIDVLLNTLGAVAPYEADGKLKVLAVGTRQRLESRPDVPALAETIPNFVVDVWFGLVAPAGTPEPVLAEIEAAVLKARELPSVREAFRIQYLEPGRETRREMAALIEAQFREWGETVERANIRE